MDILQIFVLSIIQGLTEFLPISSSGHLVLVPVVFGWKDQGLVYDVAVHVGTLLAVIWYFKAELAVILKDFFASLHHRRLIGESNIAWAVGFATIPAGLVGLLLGDWIEQHLRSTFVIATTTVVFGILLWHADRSPGVRDEKKITIKQALLIGMAQALALIPGTSRSGITITAALLLGYSRTAAARFSFLMSIPVIFLAGGLKTVELAQSGGSVEWGGLLLAVAFSFMSAYACIYLFLKMLQRFSMMPFVLYRLLLGAVLFSLYV